MNLEINDLNVILNEKKGINQKNEGRKKKYSKWMILLNSNNVADNPDLVKFIANGLKHSLVEIFSKHLGEILRMEDDEGCNMAERVEKMSLTLVAEQGRQAKGKRIHVHAVFYIEHYSKFQLDCRIMREYLNHYLLSGENPILTHGYFFRVKLIRCEKPLEDYLKKDPIDC